MEEYRTIPGFPDYQVSNLGNVRSLKRKKPRLLKPWTTAQGYKQVRLYLNTDTSVYLKVHYLVLKTFLGERPEGHCVRHLDGDRTNNELSNLAYGTSEANWNDRIDHDTYGYKLNIRKVRIIRGLHKCGFTTTRLSEIFRVTTSHISRIVHHRQWTNVH